MALAKLIGIENSAPLRAWLVGDDPEFALADVETRIRLGRLRRMASSTLRNPAPGASAIDSPLVRRWCRT